MIPQLVMSIDPGGMTGIAWLWQSGTCFYADEYGFDAAADQIEGTCDTYGPLMAVLWERYQIRPNLPQTHAHTAIEMIGVAKRYARQHHCRILPEAAQHTPTTIDRLELTAIGWWVPAKDDAQSAACHLLRWLRRTGTLPPREAAILSELAGTI